MDQLSNILKSWWNNHLDIRAEHSTFDRYQSHVTKEINSRLRASRVHMEPSQVRRETLIEEIASGAAVTLFQAASHKQLNRLQQKEFQMAVQTGLRTVLYRENTTRAVTKSTPKQSFDLLDWDTWF